MTKDWHDFAWPTEFVPIFRPLQPGTSPDDVACINYTFDSASGYRDGFRHAVSVLLEHARNNHSTLDTLVYPALFSFRHFIELALKDIIRDAKTARELPGGAPQHHRIEDLWREARSHLKAICPDEFDDRAADIVGKQIAEFAANDPFATAFRYAWNRDGGQSLAGLQHLDLGAVAQVVETIGNFLECSLIVAGQAREHVLEYHAHRRAEYEAEMRAEYGASMRFTGGE